MMAPPIVCVQFCVGDGPALLMTKRGEFTDGRQFWRTEYTPASLFAEWLNQGATIAGHNIAYDIACFCAAEPELMPLVFRAYRENRITDTMWRQKLADVGRGKYRGFFHGPAFIPLQYDLGAVGGRHGFKVNKDDLWRMYYELLDEVLLADWPTFTATVPVLKKDKPTGETATLVGADAITYALGDPLATRAAYVGQAERYSPDLLCDEYAQARRFWALHLAAVWGLRTSLRGVLSLEKGARERYDHLGAILLDAGLVRPKSRRDPTLVRDTKAAKERMRRAAAATDGTGFTLRVTKTGEVCLDSDACNSSGDPLLEAYTEFSSMSKVLSNDVEMLRKGIVHPVHTHFDMAETGRTTSSKPNVQNPRRLPGVRECYVPRGYVG
jgi:DNA polymerase-1